ncbi:inner membrane transporter RhtA [Cryptosporangium aurantiacum]|uniref:Inner membrane transporter RhtA n=1 Tax=Cryptosporangium aurantiacum TaxID=134849 RepID=A0A1M7JPY9_9ACTN|nr:EamA family transporter [Cryptosporangium aurantiacum]SHM55068.1 inner membrane transporter RhtA [Cryptosporangium aurantiacum]
MTRRTTAEGAGLVLAGVCSLQFGAALAATLFGVLGPLGMVAARLVGAALALGLAAVVVGRGRVAVIRWRLAAGFGLLTAAMNTCVYLAIDRLPLGAVITIEFLGPLGLALALSRRPRDAGWAVCALVGVVLLGGGLPHADLVGIVLALIAAGCWAGYIVLNRRLGDADGGGLSGLALSAVIAAVVVGPVGLTAGFHPAAFALGCLVGVLSSALPYALDLLALRRLSARVFGVLMSLGPAVAALAGWLVLGQALTPVQTLAIAMVVLAGVGVTAAEHRPGSAGGISEQRDVRRLVRVRLRHGEERRDALHGDVRREPFEAERNDVRVVPEPSPARGPGVRDGGGPRPRHLVRSDRGTRSGPAHQDAVVRATGDDRLGDPA